MLGETDWTRTDESAHQLLPARLIDPDRSSNQEEDRNEKRICPARGVPDFRSRTLQSLAPIVHASHRKNRGGDDMTMTLRQRSVAWRAALGVTALYALMLQAFIAAKAPYADFAASSEMLCAQEGIPSQGGDRDQHHRHATCCILACAAATRAFVAPTAWVALPVARRISAVVWTSTPAAAVALPLKPYFSARGPPRIL